MNNKPSSKRFTAKQTKGTRAPMNYGVFDNGRLVMSGLYKWEAKESADRRNAAQAQPAAAAN